MQSDALCCVMILKGTMIFHGARISSHRETNSLIVISYDGLDIWHKTQYPVIAAFETLVLHSMASICVL